MKIINPAANYYNKFTAGKAPVGKAEAAAAARAVGQGGADDQPSGITNSLELLASMGDDASPTAGLNNYARDLYQLGQSSLYATLSEFQKNGFKEFLKNEGDLADVLVYSSENVEIDPETLARAVKDDPALAKRLADINVLGKDILETL